MMANLVLAAITIKTAVKTQMDYAKSTLGGSVTIQADMESIRENQRDEMEKGGDPKEMLSKMTRPSVSVETANSIAGYSDYVKRLFLRSERFGKFLRVRGSRIEPRWYGWWHARRNGFPGYDSGRG